MKRFEVFDTCSIFIGTRQEVKTLYKKLDKRKVAMPVFTDFPKFSKFKRTYGLLVDWMDEQFPLPSMYVVNGDFIADLIVEGEI